MAQTAGYKAKLKHATTLGGSYTSIDGVTNVSDSDSLDELDISDLKDDDGYRRFILGLRGNTISFDLDESYGDTQQDAIRTAYTGRTVTFLQYLPDGTTGYKGEFWITSYNRSTSVDGKATASVTARLNGAPTPVP